MKRLPLFFSLLAAVALAMSLAYWVMQLYKPAQRPLAAAPPVSVPPPAPDAAATLFGGQAVAAVATNYQLTGVVAAGRSGVAILVADGQPPKALKVGKEIAPGVSLSEVHPRYVMLSEGGVLKRIELATDAKAGPDMAPPLPGAPPPPPRQAAQPGPAPQPTPAYQPPMNQQINVPAEVPPQLQQGQQEGQQGQQQGQQQGHGSMGSQPQRPGIPPVPPNVQMPTPTRTFSPGGGPPNQ